MTLLFSIIALLSIALGVTFGWIQYGFGIKFFVSVIIAGFFGSCLIAVVFTYMYFAHQEPNKRKEPSKEKESNKEKKPTKNEGKARIKLLKKQIAHFKKEKQKK